MSFSSDSDSGELRLEDIGLFPSCDAVYDHLSGDDEFEPNYWCWETTEGDWNQIWIMIAFMILINLGMYLLTYGAITAGLSRIRGMRTTLQRDDEDICSYISAKKWMPEPVWRDNITNNNIANIPMIIIMILVLINTILYFAIKVYIVSHPSSHYINTTNDQYHEMSFYSFFNTREIILMYIFTVNTMIFWQHQNWLIPSNTDDNNMDDTSPEWPSTIRPIARLAQLISLVDFIFFIVIFIIYYPLLIIWLYIVAVSIFIYILLGCPLLGAVCCCISPYITCCFVPCIDEERMGWFRVEQLDEVITCKCMNNCIRVLIGFMVALVQILIYFIMIAIVLCIAFLFIDGTYGPPHIVFYMDFDSYADGVIYWMFLMTIIVGTFGLFVGLFALIFVNGLTPIDVIRGGQWRENMDRRGDHVRISNDDQSDNDNNPNVYI